MSSSYKRLLAFLAAVAFGFGFLIRQTYGSHSIDRVWSSANYSDVTRQRAAYEFRSVASDVGGQSNVDLRPMETFYSVQRIVQDHYVERIRDEDKKVLSYSSVRAMLDSLKDPHTRFYESDQREIIELARQGKFYGIGAIFSVKKEKVGDISNEKLCVVTTLPGSPAEKAGIRTGDVITEIDGKSVLSYDPFQKAAKIIKSARDGAEDRDKLQKELDAEDKRIKNGISFQRSIDALTARLNKEYTLTIARGGVSAPIKVKIATAETVVDPISHAVVGKDVGYIRVRLMTKPAEDEFASAMQEFESADLKSLIIDLRDSSGGSPDVAGRIASWFAPNKVLSNLLRAHNKKQVLKIPAIPTPEGVSVKEWTRKVVILINGGTAGVPEVLAAALKDYGVGTTVGITTFGQALQQTVYVLSDGSAVGITTGKYLSPSGKDFNLKGLAAEVRVANTAKDGSDQQLARAIELVKAQ